MGSTKHIPLFPEMNFINNEGHIVIETQVRKANKEGVWYRITVRTVIMGSPKLTVDHLEMFTQQVYMAMLITEPNEGIVTVDKVPVFVPDADQRSEVERFTEYCKKKFSQS